MIALELIKTAMRLIGVIATGETPTAEEANDGLQAFNDVLETWSLESLAVYGALPETFMTVAGQSTYTLGPGGDWDAGRPISIGNAYTNVQGIDFPIEQWSLAEYNGLGLKTQRQQIAERFVFINDAPLARVILWPVPLNAVPITLDMPRILTSVTLQTEIILPPGYNRALQYAIAQELQPQYGSPIDVTSRAAATKAAIKRANRTRPMMTFDSTLLAGHDRATTWGGFVV